MLRMAVHDLNRRLRIDSEQESFGKVDLGPTCGWTPPWYPAKWDIQEHHWWNWFKHPNCQMNHYYHDCHSLLTILTIMNHHERVNIVNQTASRRWSKILVDRPLLIAGREMFCYLACWRLLHVHHCFWIMPAWILSHICHGHYAPNCSPSRWKYQQFNSCFYEEFFRQNPTVVVGRFPTAVPGI